MDITGKKIGIRKFHQDDIEPFHQAVIESVEHLQIFMPWCHPQYSTQESESWVVSREIAWNNKEDYSFVIYSLDHNELLGGIDINQINTCHRIGNVGYWVRKSALKKGVATEAVRLISSFGYNSLMLNRLEILMQIDNIASRKVAEKSGAKYEGILQKRLLVGEQFFDSYMYSLVKNA